MTRFWEEGDMQICSYASKSQKQGCANKRCKQEYSTTTGLLLFTYTNRYMLVAYVLHLLLEKSHRSRRDRERGFYTTAPQRLQGSTLDQDVFVALHTVLWTVFNLSLSLSRLLSTPKIKMTLTDQDDSYAHDRRSVALHVFSLTFHAKAAKCLQCYLRSETSFTFSFH